MTSPSSTSTPTGISGPAAAPPAAAPAPVALDTREVETMLGLLRGISLHKDGIDEAIRALDGLRREDEALEHATVSLRGRWRVRAGEAARVMADARDMAARARAAPDQPSTNFDHIVEDIDPTEPLPPLTDPAAIALQNSIDATKRTADANDAAAARIQRTFDAMVEPVERLVEESTRAFDTLYRHADSLTDAIDQVRSKARRQRVIFHAAVSASIVAGVFAAIRFFVSSQTGANDGVLVIGSVRIPWMAVAIAVVFAALQWPVGRWFEKLARRKAEDVATREVIGYFVQRAIVRWKISLHEQALRDLDSAIARQPAAVRHPGSATS